MDAAAEGTSTLTWRQPIDLSAAQTPRLVFYSKLAQSSAQAVVQAQVDGGAWQTAAIIAPSDDWAETLVNLSAYAGQVVTLRFAWIAGPSDDRWSIDLVGVDNAWQAVPPSATPLPTETLAPEATQAVNPEVTEEVTTNPEVTEEVSPAVTETASPEPTATPTVLEPEVTVEVAAPAEPDTPLPTETATLMPTETPTPSVTPTTTPTASPEPPTEEASPTVEETPAS